MDDATGDGTTSTVLIIGELLKQAENLISEVCIKVYKAKYKVKNIKEFKFYFRVYILEY